VKAMKVVKEIDGCPFPKKSFDKKDERYYFYSLGSGR
jgi:hypothetical protein